MSEQYGKDMNYPDKHIATKQLKVWAALAKTPEERKAYTRGIKVAPRHVHRPAAKGKK